MNLTMNQKDFDYLHRKCLAFHQNVVNGFGGVKVKKPNFGITLVVFDKQNEKSVLHIYNYQTKRQYFATIEHDYDEDVCLMYELKHFDVVSENA